VLGSITAKNPGLKGPRGVVQKFQEVARYFPPEDMAVSPQRGFAAGGNLPSEEHQWAKLKLVVNTARCVWHWSQRHRYAPRWRAMHRVIRPTVPQDVIKGPRIGAGR
jgi:hypothetical protein